MSLGGTSSRLTLVQEQMNLKARKCAFAVNGKVTMVLNGSGGGNHNDTLALLTEVYNQFQSIHDKLLEDAIAVIIPVAATGNTDNQALSKAYTSLRMIKPKHVGVKIGPIPMEQRDCQTDATTWLSMETQT